MSRYVVGVPQIEEDILKWMKEKELNEDKIKSEFDKFEKVKVDKAFKNYFLEPLHASVTSNIR